MDKPLQIEMEREDWAKLADFARIANAARKAIQRAISNGKQQVSTRDEDLLAFAAADIDTQFWLRLGSLIGQQLIKDPEV